MLHCRQSRTKPQPRITCTENSAKFGRVIFEIGEQTDKTDIQAPTSQYFAAVPEAK